MQGWKGVCILLSKPSQPVYKYADCITSTRLATW